MDLELLLIILIDGLVYGSYLFMVSVGLTVICGVQKILNVAHGSFYAFGAYLAATLLILYAQVEGPQFGAFAVMLFAAIFLGIVFGVILERGLLRHLYHEDEHIIILATFAAFLVLEDVLLLIWGTDPYIAAEPLGLLGQTDIAGLPFDNYSLSMVLLSAVVGGGLWYGLNRTTFGKLLLAVIHDREIAQAMGINVNRIFLLTFMVGSFLGALGGAYQAPAISVQPGIGVEVIVLAFAVVVIGGMGSIPGALIGSVIVGVARAFAVHQEPALELFVIYMIMAAVLIVRPQGLFAPAKARSI